MIVQLECTTILQFWYEKAKNDEQGTGILSMREESFEMLPGADLGLGVRDHAQLQRAMLI